MFRRKQPGLPPSLTLPRKGGGASSTPSATVPRKGGGDSSTPSTSSDNGSRAFAGFLAAGGGLALVTVVGLIVPGSVVAYPHSIVAGEPITVLYAFGGGQLVLLGTLALLCVCFVAALIAAFRVHGSRGHGAALAVATALAGLYIAVYPSGSQDLFHNIADARTLWVYGQNPMTVPPSAHAADPLVVAVIAWRDDPSFYGPLSYVLYGMPAALAGDGVLANMLAFKAFNAVALLMLTLLVGRLADSLGHDRTRAMVMVGWNPLLLYEMVGNGHNDVLMAVLVVAALILATGAVRPADAMTSPPLVRAGGEGVHQGLRNLAALLVLGLAATVKYPAFFLGPVLWWWCWIRGASAQRARLVALGLGGAALLVALALIFAPDLQAGREAAVGRPPVRAPISALAHGLAPAFGDHAVPVARFACWGAFLLCTLGALRRMDISRQSLVTACFWAMTALTLLTVRQIYPSYLIWFVCLGAALVGSLAWEVALTASISGLLSYVIFTDWPRWGPLEDLTYFAAFIAAPTGFLILRWGASHSAIASRLQKEG